MRGRGEAGNKDGQEGERRGEKRGEDISGEMRGKKRRGEARRGEYGERGRKNTTKRHSCAPAWDAFWQALTPFLHCFQHTPTPPAICTPPLLPCCSLLCSLPLPPSALSCLRVVLPLHMHAPLPSCLLSVLCTPLCPHFAAYHEVTAGMACAHRSSRQRCRQREQEEHGKAEERTKQRQGRARGARGTQDREARLGRE
jgi:hypothetical protein